MDITNKNENRILCVCAPRVRLELDRQRVAPGDWATVRIVVRAAAEATAANGIFVDLTDTEEIAVEYFPPARSSFSFSHRAMNEAFRIAPPFTLEANETKTFEGTSHLPVNFQPTFAGQFSRHEWQIRASRNQGVGTIKASGAEVWVITDGKLSKQE